MNEIVPMEHFFQILRAWWVLALCMVLGGVGGYIFHSTHPAIYEATASFYVTLDFSEIGEMPLTQYDEDLALSVVRDVVFHNPELHEQVVTDPVFQASGLDRSTLIRNISIEREHAFWKLHFRYTDPRVARDVVNRWAELGYEALLSWKEEGKMAAYIRFDPPGLADLPQSPTHYGLNRLILAGSLIGFVVGVLVCDRVSQWLGGSR